MRFPSFAAGFTIDTPIAHFVLVTTGSAGDLFPFLKLGTELRQRGHRVTVFAPALHAPIVQQAGLPFHGSVADPAVLEDPDLWHPRRGFGVVWRAVRPGLAGLLPMVQALAPGPVLIVAHPLAIADAVLCRSLREDVRVVAAYLAPSNIPTVYDPLMIGPLAIPRWVPHPWRRWLWKRVAANFIDPVAMPDVNAQRRRSGLEPVDNLLDFMRDAPDLAVALFPQWFGRRQPDWPQALCQGDFTLYDPAPDAAFSPELARFLECGDAPLVFTHGTGNQQADRFFAAALSAVRMLGRRAIFLTPHRAQVPAALPANVLWQDYLPLQKLLPLAAALAHHGGIGTTAEALRAGVPQLVVPLAYDQFDNGARVRALGAGLVLPHSRVSAALLAKTLQQLSSSSSIPMQCRAISLLMEGDSALGPLVDTISNSISESGNN
jgi:rhamnosyltransferase subunit B